MEDIYIPIIVFSTLILFSFGFAYFLGHSFGRLLIRFEINENYDLYVYEKIIRILRNKKIRVFGPPVFHELNYIEYKNINYYTKTNNAITINFNPELNFSGKPSEYIIKPNNVEELQKIEQILQIKLILINKNYFLYISS